MYCYYNLNTNSNSKLTTQLHDANYVVIQDIKLSIINICIRSSQRDKTYYNNNNNNNNNGYFYVLFLLRAHSPFIKNIYKKKTTTTM